MTDTAPPLSAYEEAPEAGSTMNGSRHAPPSSYSPELELDLAHVLLVHPDKVPALIDAGLDPAAFHRWSLRDVAAAVLEAHRAGEVVDLHTIGRHGIDEMVVRDVVSHAVSTTDAERIRGWVHRLAELAAERQVDEVLATARQARADGLPLAKVREALLEVATDHTAGGFTSDPSFDAFLDTDEPAYDWLVEGIVERGDRIVVTGEEGMGKSTLLRQAGVQVAAGVHPFTGDDIEPLSVLLVDCENSARQVRRALGPLRDATDGRAVNLRARVLGHAIDLARAEVYDDLARRVEHYDADLLIVGPIYKLTEDDPTKEVPARQVADTLDRLRQIRGTALLLEAHTPYADGSKSKRPMRPYGASLWSRWPEFGIFLAPDGQLHHWRGQRDQRDWPRKLVRSQPWPWMVDHDAPQTEEWHGPTRCIEAVVSVLDELAGEELSTNQLAKALRERGRGYRNQVVAEAANQAADEGKIRSRSGGRGAVLFAALGDEQQAMEAF